MHSTYPATMPHLTEPARSPKQPRRTGSATARNAAQPCFLVGEENVSAPSYSSYSLCTQSLLPSLLHRVAEDIGREAEYRSLLPVPQALHNAPVTDRDPTLLIGPEALEAALQDVTARLMHYLTEAGSGNGSGNDNIARGTATATCVPPTCDICTPLASVEIPAGGSSGGLEEYRGWKALATPVGPVTSQEHIASILMAPSGASGSSADHACLGGHAKLVRPGPPPLPPRNSHTLQLNLLGHPQVFIDGMRLAELERSDRRSHVIQLLALHRGSLSCDELAEAISLTSHQYEDEPINRHYVRNLVWRVRVRIERRTGWSGVIHSPTKGGMGAHYYQLADGTVCDLWEFEDKLDQADRLVVRAVGSRMPRAPQVPQVPQVRQGSETLRTPAGGVTSPMSDEDVAAVLREEALQLYRGEFCEGSNLGQIVQAARMLEERYIRSALQQADYWRARALCAGAAIGPEVEMRRLQEGPREQDGALDPRPGSPEPEQGMAWREALRNYERVLRIDNYHEEAYKHAMECYARLGNASGVGQIFARCQDILHADLMQPPGESVVRAYEECKALLGA